jgi:hypothetical protein
MNRHVPFAIEASVTYSGAWGDRSVRYWHQAPHYWRAEQDGRIIMMSCDDGWVSHDEASWPVRWLAWPDGVRRQASTRLARPDGHAVTFLGRQATRHDLDPHGTMTVDDETGFVLELRSNERHLVTETFTTPDALDPALFGEEALDTSWEGSYSGHLP